MVESLKDFEKSQQGKKAKNTHKSRINGMLALPPSDPELEEGGNVCSGWSFPEGSARKIE